MQLDAIKMEEGKKMFNEFSRERQIECIMIVHHSLYKMLKESGMYKSDILSVLDKLINDFNLNDNENSNHNI